MTPVKVFPWTTVAPILGSVAAGVTIFFALWTRFGRIVWDTCRRWLGYVSPLRGINEKLDWIGAQLEANGGHTLKDVVVDIQQKQKESASRQKTALFQTNRLSARVLSILDNSPFRVWEADTEGNRTWANGAYLDLVGRTLAEIIGYGWVNVIHYDDRERVRLLWAQAILEQRVFDENYRLIHRTGKVIPCHTVARPFAPDGTLTSWIAYVTPLKSDGRPEEEA